MVFVALLTKSVLFQDEDFLVNIHALFVLGLALKALGFGFKLSDLIGKRVHFKFDYKNHRFECY
jgi:hypothetical protein